MQDIGSVLVRVGLVLVVVLLVRMGFTAVDRPKEQPRVVQLSQTWELQPGDVVAGYQVTGGLGDISIELKGNTIYAPFDGRVQPYKDRCVIFSSDEVPAYLFRLCGLQQPQLGKVRSGDAIGAGPYLQVATLRRQPSGTWSFVEPSRHLVEQLLSKP